MPSTKPNETIAFQLTGSQYSQLTDALINAFPTLSRLEQMVRFKLEQDLDTIARNDNLTNTAFDLIRWAESTGKVDALVKGAREENPGNPALQAFAKAYEAAATEASTDAGDATVQPSVIEHVRPEQQKVLDKAAPKNDSSTHYNPVFTPDERDENEGHKDELIELVTSIAWLQEAIRVASRSIGELRQAFDGQWTEEGGEKLNNVFGVIDEVVMQLFFAVAYRRNQPAEPEARIPDELRCDFYNAVKPLIEQVVDFALDRDNGMMFAPTAHKFMQLLNSLLKCDPKGVLHFASGVAKSSEPFGYNLDSLAVADVVELVEAVLADYRSEVRDGESLQDLLEILDTFAKTGWPEALRLVWRLDEIFR